ncbi:MAG: hypothetical protein AB1Z98_27585 [Nannocystaceae bacterium]
MTARGWSWPRGGLVAVALAVLGASPAAAAEPRRTTVFLDFGGGLLSPGQGGGEASCVTGQFRYPMFLGSQRAAQLALDEARRLLAPYGVRVVGQRPPSPLPFTHVRVGGEPQTLGLDPRLNGLSCEVDCDDQLRPDTVFMFADKWVDRVTLSELEEDQLALQIGRIAIHEAAHAWGLEHTGGSESIMARFPTASVPSFVVGCQPLDLDEAAQCPQVHARTCPEGAQDADAELRALFGDGEPDTTPPQVEIVWPPDGLELRAGDELTVQVTVQDDYPGFGWVLEVPQLDWRHESIEPGEHELSLVVPQGRWTLELAAIDHDRNVGEAAVTFVATVEDAEVEEPVGGSQASCACGQGPGATGGGLAWLLLLGLGLTGRRRSIPAVPRST